MRSRKFWHAFRTRGVQAAVAVNLAPYILTYRAYQGDGYELVGWPFVFFKSGGFIDIRQFSMPALLGDLCCGVLNAPLSAHTLQDGFRALW